MAFGASRRQRLDNYRLRRTVSIDDMVSIQRTLMRAGTALNNSLCVASVGVMGKVRGVPVLLSTVAGRKTGVKQHQSCPLARERRDSC
jgi:hypothetical protein